MSDGNLKKRFAEQVDTQHKKRYLVTSSNNNSEVDLTSEIEEDQFKKPFNPLRTISSYNSSIFNDHLSSESVYHFNKVPSSPPNYQNGNFLDSSPQKLTQDTVNNLFTSQVTVTQVADDEDDEVDAGKYDMAVDSESDVEFNVTNLNRIHGYVSSDYLDTNHEERTLEAIRRIRNSFENGDPIINFENLGLKTIPDEIEDLKDMVHVDRNGIALAKIQIYAQHNNLKVLPPSLFNVTNINVLTLRNNKIRKIPGKIKKLVNLTDLSIFSNEIKSLSDQILKLPKLNHLLIRPNLSLIELDFMDKDSVKCLSNEVKNSETNVKRYASNIKWMDGDERLSERDKISSVSCVPKLFELCLRGISKYDVTRSETKLWKSKIPKHIQLNIAKAIQKGVYEETCSTCNQIVVNAIGKSLEWWDFKNEKLIPISRKFCCGNCVKQWVEQRDLEHENYLKCCGEVARTDVNELQNDNANELHFNEEF